MKANMLVDGLSPISIKGRGSIKLIIKKLPLTPQLFTINIGLRDDRGEVIASTINSAAGFFVKMNKRDLNNGKELPSQIKGSPMLLSYEWRYENEKFAPRWGKNKKK